MMDAIVDPSGLTHQRSAAGDLVAIHKRPFLIGCDGASRRPEARRSRARLLQR